MTQKMLEVGQKMTKRALMGRWPQPKPTFNVWNKEKKEWGHSRPEEASQRPQVRSHRSQGRSWDYTDSCIRERHRKSTGLSFPMGVAPKKEEIIMAPHIIPLHMVKPEPKDTAELLPKDEEGKSDEIKEATTLKETDNLK